MATSKFTSSSFSSVVINIDVDGGGVQKVPYQLCFIQRVLQISTVITFFISVLIAIFYFFLNGVQMNLLRILSLLGRGDQASSEGMYEVLVDVMRRADTGINVGYAIGE